MMRKLTIVELNAPVLGESGSRIARALDAAAGSLGLKVHIVSPRLPELAAWTAQTGAQFAALVALERRLPSLLPALPAGDIAVFTNLNPSQLVPLARYARTCQGTMVGQVDIPGDVLELVQPERLKAYLGRLSERVDALDPDGCLSVCVTSEFAHARLQPLFRREVVLLPGPVVVDELPPPGADRGVPTIHVPVGHRAADVAADLDRCFKALPKGFPAFQIIVDAPGGPRTLRMPEQVAEVSGAIAAAVPSIGSAAMVESDLVLIADPSLSTSEILRLASASLESGRRVLAAEPFPLTLAWRNEVGFRTFPVHQTGSFGQALAPLLRMTTAPRTGHPLPPRPDARTWLTRIAVPQEPRIFRIAAAPAGVTATEYPLFPPPSLERLTAGVERREPDRLTGMATLGRLLLDLHPNPVSSALPKGSNIESVNVRLRDVAATWTDGAATNEAAFEALRERCASIRRCVILHNRAERFAGADFGDAAVIGVNAAFSILDGLNCAAPMVVLERREYVDSHINRLRTVSKSTIFLPYYLADLDIGTTNVIRFNHQTDRMLDGTPLVSFDARDLTLAAYSTVNTALQIAITLGFKEIDLVDNPTSPEQLAYLDAIVAGAIERGITVRSTDNPLTGDAQVIRPAQPVPVATPAAVAAPRSPEPATAKSEPQPHPTPSSASKPVQEHALPWSPPSFPGPTIPVPDLATQSKRTDVGRAAESARRALRLAAEHTLPGSGDADLEARLAGIADLLRTSRDAFTTRLRHVRRALDGYRRCVILGDDASVPEQIRDTLRDLPTMCLNTSFQVIDVLSGAPRLWMVESRNEYAKVADAAFARPDLIKLLPFGMADLLPTTENVVLFDHRARRSYPHGYDFSLDAAECTYSSGFVLMTAIQLAFSLGFQEIVVAGVRSTPGSSGHDELAKALAVAQAVITRRGRRLGSMTVDPGLPLAPI